MKQHLGLDASFLTLTSLCWEGVHPKRVSTAHYVGDPNSLFRPINTLTEFQGPPARTYGVSDSHSCLPTCCTMLPQNFECTDLFNSDFQATLACGDGAASHVFQPKATDRTRYANNISSGQTREGPRVSPPLASTRVTLFLPVTEPRASRSA